MSGLWRCYEVDWLQAGLSRWNRRSTPLCRARVRSSIVLLLLIVLTTGCQEQILHDLSEKEANKVVRHLSESGMAVEKVSQADGRWAIAVQQKEVTRALGYLDSQRILSVRDSKVSSASKGSFIPSREEQRFRYERSISASLEESLTAMPGVLEARVHLNLPEEDPLFGSRPLERGSGSVLLVVDERFEAPDGEIAALVGGAAGIPSQGVRVLKSRALMPVPEEPLRAATIPAITSSEPPLEVPWKEMGMSLPLCVLGWCAYRWSKRAKKRVVFSLPKELQCEA